MAGLLLSQFYATQSVKFSFECEEGSWNALCFVLQTETESALSSSGANQELCGLHLLGL